MPTPDEKFIIDFNVNEGRIKKELYGSGLHVFIANRRINNNFEWFKNLRFPIVRNHDWALNNANQRLIDIHHIFPLMHLDPNDERNYVFAPSDEVIRVCYEAGSKVFYRLGTSIEHTGVKGQFHFNSIPPVDYEKFADVCAGVVRHYTRGWNNGFHYDMQYWEIWNEPEGHDNMWTGTDEEFARFFAIVLKRLKSEFPELKIGGPAHCTFRPTLIDMIKAECDKLDVKPDFYSYHMYSNNLQDPVKMATEPKAYLEKIGWGDVETCINEWHFIRTWIGVHSTVTEESYQHSMYNADGLMGINSAAFNMAVYAIWQKGGVDSAYYYGCGNGNWGMTYPSTRFNKNYYSMLCMRDLVYDYPNAIQITGGTSTQRALGGISDDGKKAAIVITDFCGPEPYIEFQLKGWEKPSSIKCLALDDVTDLEPIGCFHPGANWIFHPYYRQSDAIPADKLQDANGNFQILKRGAGSAVYMLLLEK